MADKMEVTEVTDQGGHEEMEVTDQGGHEEIFTDLPRKLGEMNISSGAANCPAQPALLFYLNSDETRTCQRMFYYSAIQDRRLPPFLDRVEERIVTFPEAIEHRHGCGMLAIGGKVVFWRGWSPETSFTSCITTVDNDNFNWVFRDLDTSTIRSRDLDTSPIWLSRIWTAITGNRLIFYLYGSFSSQSWLTARMFSLDINTETWSILPDCHYHESDIVKTVLWKGNLYKYNLAVLSGLLVDDVCFFHFDFERNLWLDRFSSPVSTAFAERLMQLPIICLKSAYFVTPSSIISSREFLISSRSGTLYAIFGNAELFDFQYSSIPVFAMDDLERGWTEVSSGRIVDSTRQQKRFPLPTRACQICGKPYDDGFLQINFWEIGEHDILLVVVQFHPICMDRLRYRRWVFNKDDGVKSYGCGELPVPVRSKNPKFDIDLLVAKLE